MPAGDWGTIRDEIASAGQLDYKGASGEVTSAPPSPDTQGPYYIGVWTIENDQPTSVEIRTISPN
ncbi:MAG: hypothetical protein SFX73_12750 [Kofleriaceae bacterium]|nr:hypothetical protein [Kofleriaceae bacterium]